MSAERVCEECSRIYITGPQWSNGRVCYRCMNRIRIEVGDPPLDMDLSAEEREYLRETLGLEKYEDAQLQADAPFCRSCIVHGSDRKAHPCLRERNQCGWARQRQQAPTGTTTAGNFWIQTGLTSTTSNYYNYNTNTIQWGSNR